MKLENQVCTLEQAKRLKELGIEQASHLSWFGDETTRVMDNGSSAEVGSWLFISQTNPVNNQQADQREDTCTTKPIAAAFTVAELGVMLPPDYQWSWPMMSRDIWVCAYCDVGAEGADSKYEQEGRTEAEARANMLIHLLESGKFTAEESIQRLNA